VDFALLRDRLLLRLRVQLQNGESSERSLARLAGISQPHVHNVLKGARILTTEIADVILSKLNMSILDLIDLKELEAVLAARNETRVFTRVALLDGLIGPGYPWPTSVAAGQYYWVQQGGFEAARIVAVRLAADAQLLPFVQAGSVAFIDVGQSGRFAPDLGVHYAVSSGSTSSIRKLSLMRPLQPAELIRGRVVLIAPAGDPHGPPSAFPLA
jgi:hypothetical protein